MERTVRRAREISLSADERAQLAEWADSHRVPARIRRRAQVILEAVTGRSNGEIARLLGVHPETVMRWRRRFGVNRLEGLRRDAPRSGGRAQVSSSMVAQILRMTTEGRPPEGRPWSTRSLARALEVNHMLVHRVWRSHGIDSPSARRPIPALWPGPRVDVVGFYLDNPTAAIVFAVDAGQYDAEDPPARAGADPDRAGGFRLPEPARLPEALVKFVEAAQDSLPRLADARRSPHEFLVFLRRVEESNAPSSVFFVLLDRPIEFISTRLGSWLAAHPRFSIRATDAAGSWASVAEEWARSLSDQPFHPDSFRSLPSLLATATEQGRALQGTREAPRRLSWTSLLRDGAEPPLARAPSTARWPHGLGLRRGENSAEPRLPTGS